MTIMTDNEMPTGTVVNVGDSLAIALPRERVAKLNLTAGTSLHLMPTTSGLLVTKAPTTLADAEFQAAMARTYHETFEALYQGDQ